MHWEVSHAGDPIAKSAGFCYGVRRAVELAEKTARENGGCVMLGSIIHNANVVAQLERLGARQADTPDQVVSRRHGDHPLPRRDKAGAGAAGGNGRPVRQRYLPQRAAHSAASCPGRTKPGAFPWSSGSPTTRRSWARPAGRTGLWCFPGRRNWSSGCWRTPAGRICP